MANQCPFALKSWQIVFPGIKLHRQPKEVLKKCRSSIFGLVNLAVVFVSVFSAACIHRVYLDSTLLLLGSS